MPNKIDPNKLHSSITLQRSLIAELDRIAVKEDRSRNKVIEILLVSQLKEYDDSKGLRPLEVDDPRKELPDADMIVRVIINDGVGDVIVWRDLSEAEAAV